MAATVMMRQIHISFLLPVYPTVGATVAVFVIGCIRLSNVAEPVHFCAASASACQKFRLRLLLRLQFRPFSPYIFEKI
jgi:hypothetical protein